MAQITMKEMLDSGVHFGHQTQRWNPKMKPFVYTNRGGIHIIDLQKTVEHAKKAGDFVRNLSANGGKIIFVGTKKQAMKPIQDAAGKAGQFFITKRWLGGTLTNFTTIKMRIDRMKRIEQMREKGDLQLYSKKERGKIEKEYEKLVSFLEGIRDMKEAPAAVFVCDLNKEHIAVKEAQKLGLPVVAIADTNTDPDKIDYPIPGNDDAIRSISLFSNFIAECYLDGAKEYEVKLREEKNKAAADAAAEKKAEEEEASKKDDKSGPTVVKRKFVAAGLAEDVEIEMELDRKEKEEPEAAEVTEEKAEDKK